MGQRRGPSPWGVCWLSPQGLLFPGLCLRSQDKVGPSPRCWLRGEHPAVDLPSPGHAAAPGGLSFISNLLCWVSLLRRLKERGQRSELNWPASPNPVLCLLGNNGCLSSQYTLPPLLSNNPGFQFGNPCAPGKARPALASGVEQVTWAKGHSGIRSGTEE